VLSSLTILLYNNFSSQKYPGGSLRIFFGSQTGTAEGFARTLMEEGKEAGFDAKIVDLEDFDADMLSQTKLAIFLMATYGEGEPTDNAARFVKWLKNEDESVDSSFLSNVEFTVFGLGNRQYEHYNRMGKLTNKLLEKLGGKRVVEYGEGDDDGTLEEDFDAWKAKLWPSFKAHFHLEDSSVHSQGSTLSAPKHVSLEFNVKSLGKISTDKISDLRTSQKSVKHHASTKHFWTAPHATIVANSELRNISFNKAGEEVGSTRHIEISLKGTGLTYITADNLAILPENPSDKVISLANTLGYDLDDVVDFEATSENKDLKPMYPTPCSVRDLLTLYVDIQGSLRHSTLKTLSSYVSDSGQQKWISTLLVAENRAKFKHEIEDQRKSLCDLLTNELSSAKIPIADFLHIASPIQPRYYTISSSSSLYPETVHVTVSVTEYKVNGKTFTGLCSGFLRDLIPKQSQCRIFVRASTFRLPKSISTPIILIGPGTGIAPMRAILQERSVIQSKQGKSDLGSCALFFGCKYADMDYIYRSELENFVKSEVLTELYTAFSRETNKKIYVQHLLSEPTTTKKLLNWILNENAHIYVCGATAMGADVMAALTQIIQAERSFSTAEASAYIKKLQDQNRYIQELWTA
jgi:NADPH-ferrihemoprotein reductase